MAREDPTIYMRIPAELKERLDSASKAAGRSLTAEVVARLTDSLNGPVARDLTFPEIVAALTKAHEHTLDNGGVTITVEVTANPNPMREALVKSYEAYSAQVEKMNVEVVQPKLSGGTKRGRSRKQD
jgi:hypothetical protein